MDPLVGLLILAAVSNTILFKVIDKGDAIERKTTAILRQVLGLKE